MVRKADVEMTVTKKENFYTHRSLETMGMAHRATQGSQSGGRMGRMGKGQSVGPSPSLWFSWEEMGTQV